jgi:hypothetical protein
MSKSREAQARTADQSFPEFAVTICGGEFIRHRDPRHVAEQGRPRTPLVGGRANHPNPSGKDASLWLSINLPLLLSAQPPLLGGLVLARLRHSP